MNRLWRGFTASAGVFIALSSACGYDSGSRWLDREVPAPNCTVGKVRCAAERVERCNPTLSGADFQLEQDCASTGQVCNQETVACLSCQPGRKRCDGFDVYACDDDGTAEQLQATCDVADQQVCREGACVNLCSVARQSRSNVGCEYWPVDLDNARIRDTSNAAAQQFAVVISNPEPDITSEVVIEQDDSSPGEEPQIVRVARERIPPFSLRVFKLGPREVDGSADGTFNTGTHTALTRHAYRVTASSPVVAYQFNPLENVAVFSNDASLLKPVEALGAGGQSESLMYAVLGWPQTIAVTSDPETNFDPGNPTNLRAFLTLVGTRADTHVTVDSRVRIVGGGEIAATPKNGKLSLTLQPFEVANLETGGFNADFTGSLVKADAPVVAYSGSEASDAPYFDTLTDRRCCADHLEEQLDHVRTAGRRFVASVSANRSQAIALAGAPIGVGPQNEYFRVIATTENGARIRTSLPDFATISLRGLGDFATLVSTQHFMIESDWPIQLASISPSQGDANIPTAFPGGDPSLVIVPPIEQFRATYVFLTPDKYAFDFVRVIAPPDTEIALDGQVVSELSSCEVAPGDGLSEAERGRADAEFVVYTCQLSFPRIDPDEMAPNNVLTGSQNDGVHTIIANRPVSVIVDGFDHFVSYAYAGGTELTFIDPD